MATVRMTRDLRQDILNNIQKMFNGRHEKMMTEVKAKMQEMEHEILTYLFPPDVVNELCNPKYKGYVKYANSVNFRVQANNKWFVFELKFIGGMLPIKFDSSSYYLSEHNYTIESTAPLYPRIKTILDPLHQIEQDRTTLVNQIEELLAKVPSLKKLIEVWPSALDFVSPRYVEQHNRPVVYEKRAKVEVAMDIETKANLLKARMGDVT